MAIRKNVYIHLTPYGRSLKAKLVPLAVEVNEIAMGDVCKAARSLNFASAC